MLANQNGETVQQNRDGDRTWFPVGREFGNNLLLNAFDAGMYIGGKLADRGGSDKFREEKPVGIDQLLMIRLGQELGAAPDKIRGSEGPSIPNQRPIAEQAAQDFSEDIRRFVRSYAGVIPRQAFVALLESCMAIGLTTILNSVIELMLAWADSGEIRKKRDQHPPPLFVDASTGIDFRLRALSEQCFEDFLRRVQRFPAVLMGARLLDYRACYNRNIKDHAKNTWPYATEWVNLLGSTAIPGGSSEKAFLGVL